MSPVHEEIGDASQRSHRELASVCVEGGTILDCQNLTDRIYGARKRSSPATVRVNERNDARQGK